MTQTAKVTEVIGAGRVLVAVRRKTACSADCETCHGCAHPDETIVVPAENDAGAVVGDQVVVESRSSQIIALASLLYLMPLVLMIGGYFLPFSTEGRKIVCSIAGLLVGLGICILYSRHMKQNGKMTFCVIEVLDRK